jgi:DNA mismatch endonuclease Vsr
MAAPVARRAPKSARHGTTAHRSWTMSRVRSENTTPDLLVRKMAHALGLSFRLHRRELPGKPDIVFPKRRIAMFVNGCFWHSHRNCKRALQDTQVAQIRKHPHGPLCRQYEEA